MSTNTNDTAHAIGGLRTDKDQISLLSIRDYIVSAGDGSSNSGKGQVHIYIKVWGSLSCFTSFFPKYPTKMKQFGLTETNLFHFHRIF